MKKLLKYRKLFIKVSMIVLFMTAMAQNADSIDCGPGKVAICHNPTTNPVTICVPPAAVPAHLAQGDLLGECPATRQVDVDAPPDQEGKLGETIYYTFSVENQGTIPDTYRLTLTSEHGFQTGEIPEQVHLDPWKDIDISTWVALPLSGDFTSDRLTLSAVSVFDKHVKESEFVTTYITSPEPGIAFTKTADKRVLVPGEQVIYTFRYENTGNIPLLDVVIEDRLPEQLRFEESSLPVDVIGERTLEFEVDPVLYQEERGTFTLTARVKEYVDPKGQIVNTASLSAQGLLEPVTAQAVSSIEVPDLAIEKSSNRSAMTVGDILLYTITVSNNGSGTALSAKVVDTLPSVMRYVPGTSVVNGSIVNDPQHQGTQQLVWEVENLYAGQQVTLRYQVVVIAGTKSGSFRNEAMVQAYNTGGIPVTDGPAVAEIQVKRAGRTFSAEIAGIVFEDRNGKGSRDPDEPGLPRIDVILIRDLLRQTSDEHGEFVFTGLEPGKHAVGLDERSLPEKYRLTTSSTVLLSLSEGDRGLVEFGVLVSLRKPWARLYGRVFLDLNGDGQYDNEEPLIPAFVAVLNDKTVNRGKQGKFVLSNILPGKYSIEIRYEKRSYLQDVELDEGENHCDFPVNFSGIGVSIERE